MLPLHGKRLRFSLLDLVIVLALLGAAVFVFHRVRDGLNYRWEWSTLPQYLFRFDGEQGRWVPNVLMQGFFTTLRLSIWATVFAALIGTTMGLLRLSRSRFRRWTAAAYVELTRNTPPLVLVFVFYYFIGEQVLPRLGPEAALLRLGPGAQSLLSTLLAPPGLLTAFLSAVVTLSIIEGAYITEIVRAGVQSIDRGQREAGAALGLSRRQRLRHVILPQALQRILPPLGGQFISTIKDSAIVSVISIQELTFRGMELMSATYLTFETWITISAMYFLLTFGCSLGFERLEKRLRRRGA
jgi:polar amino acid transport system permease protein